MTASTHSTPATKDFSPPLAKLFGWVVTPLFLLLSALTLCTWHPLIAISRRVSPIWFHEWFIALGNRILQLCFFVTGGAIRFHGTQRLPPTTGTTIIISNHQSLFDIPILIWLLRRHHAKFIAKQSLARGLPSASYVLRTNGHALIDRSDPIQATKEISALADRVLSQGQGTVVLFPEGTRSRDGQLKKFKVGGLKVLLEKLPDAEIVPVSIDGAWKIMRYGFLPVPAGINVTVTVHEPLIRNGTAWNPAIALEQSSQAIAAKLRPQSRL